MEPSLDIEAQLMRELKKIKSDLDFSRPIKEQLTSLEQVELVVTIENTFSISVELVDFKSGFTDSIEKMTQFVQSKQSQNGTL